MTAAAHFRLKNRENVVGSPVSWAPDRVVVAASGDLGVTIGMIRPNEPPPAGAAPGFAFFTIWYRASPAVVALYR